jgi:hypothetical protein
MPSPGTQHRAIKPVAKLEDDVTSRINFTWERRGAALDTHTHHILKQATTLEYNVVWGVAYMVTKTWELGDGQRRRVRHWGSIEHTTHHKAGAQIMSLFENIELPQHNKRT